MEHSPGQVCVFQGGARAIQMVIQARIIKCLLFIQQSSSDLHRWGKTHCDSPVQRKDRSHDERQTYESSIDSIKLNQHPLIKFVPTNFKGAIWFIPTYFCHCVISSIGHNNIVQTKWTGKVWDMVTSLTKHYIHPSIFSVPINEVIHFLRRMQVMALRHSSVIILTLLSMPALAPFTH